MTPVTDNRNLDDRERELLKRLLSDPLSFPVEFKEWLVNYLETSNVTLSKRNVHGLERDFVTWEDIGDSGGSGGGGGVQGFCTAEGFESNYSGGSQHELLFTDPTDFNSNDPASFDISGNQIRILQPGGYLIFGQLLVSGFASETSDLALIEIYDIYGTDAAGHRVNGVYPTDTPVPAIISKSLLPGAGGFAPTLQYMAFINLRDDYAGSAYRPAAFPVTMHMRMSWSVSSPHSLTYSLGIMRFADAPAGVPSGGGGIQFDVEPQPGGLLRIDASKYIDIRTADNFSLLDTGGGGIYLDSRSGSKGGGFLGINCDGEIFLHGYTVVSRMSGGAFEIQDSGANIWSQFLQSHGFWMNLGTGNSFLLGNHINNPLMRVDENGTYHIKAGATWVADL